MAFADPAEFEKLQRAMNERIEVLEAELQDVRRQWQIREGHYQAQVAQLSEQNRKLEAELAETKRHPAAGRDWESNWSVRRAAPAESGQTQEESDGFDAIFAGEPEPEPLVESDDAPSSVEVVRAVQAGRRRISNRRDEPRWRRALELTVRNRTDAPLRVSAWAHQPGRMGWQLDEFGVTVFSIPPQATITNKLIAHDPGTELRLILDGTTYTFPVADR